MSGFALVALASGAEAQTVLHLSETATVSIAPDRLTGLVRADAAADSPASAQGRVNAMIMAAIAQAKETDGIAVSTEQYNVWRLEAKAGEPAQWRASQSLLLHGQDGPTVLKLVGALQERGLAVERLAWELSPDRAKSAEREAALQALRSVRGRADEIAGAVGLVFDAYRSLTVGNVPPMPIRGRSMPMEAATFASPTEPSAQAEEARVDATVEADILLKPR